MGVHKAEAYAEVKRLLGIPEDEPIFILRAQDRLAEDAIVYYAHEYRRKMKSLFENELTDEQGKFFHGACRIADDFFEWGLKHTTKIPD